MKVINGGGGGFPSAITVTGNSSESSIADGANFTGAWTQVAVGSLLTVDLKSDVDLTLQIQYSVDGGTTTDSSLTRYYRTSFIFPPQLFKNARPYVRLVVTNNSGGATSTLRLDSYISQGEAILNTPLDSTMSKDFGAIATRPTYFTDEVALGRRQGWSTWNKFGFNLDVDSASEEILASFGGTFSIMSSADTLEIVSTSANDDDGGTGVNSVVIYGVDENRNEQIEVVTMNGTSAVTTSNQWLGVNRVAVFLSGSGQTNAGTINITVTAGGAQQAQMPIGGGVTQQCIFFVPQNHNFLMSYIRLNANKLSGGSAPKVTFKGLVYSAVNNTIQEIYRDTIDTSVENSISLKLEETIPVGEKSVIYFVVDTDTNNTVVTGRFGGKLARDADA